MKLIAALEILKSKGITKLTGMSGQEDIDKYIENALRCDEDAARWSEQGWAKYHTEHADRFFIIETNGHYIIAEHGDAFDMRVYGNYENEDNMRADFDEWRIMRDANAIADEMVVKRPGEFSHTVWVLMSASELRAAHEANMEAFEREFTSVN